VCARFVFCIRTKSGNIVIEAEQKLRQSYPDCEILNCEMK
jgi:hypothetical protein